MSLTPDTINTIKRNAGKLPPEQIARACGVSLGLVERIAREQGFDLRIPVASPADVTTLPRPPAPIERGRRGLPLHEQRTVSVTVNLCEASAAALRAKAQERVVRPAALMRQLLEGAIVRNALDDLVSAARFYRPGDVANEKETA